MLSGKVPFHIRSTGDTADAIMKQIKSGQFDLQGPEWKDVSVAAKKIIKGTGVNVTDLLACVYKKNLFVIDDKM